MSSLFYLIYSTSLLHTCGSETDIHLHFYLLLLTLTPLKLNIGFTFSDSSNEVYSLIIQWRKVFYTPNSSELSLNHSRLKEGEAKAS
jgi:hypothetical protein